MFIRLIAIADRIDSIETIFKHELTTKPASLFKDDMMRHTQKSALLKVLLSDDGLVDVESLQLCGCTVVDGGALLHRVRWLKDTKFVEIASLYYNYYIVHMPQLLQAQDYF